MFITSERAAINMAWQELGKQLNCTPTPLFTIKGQEMMGLPLSAPNCTFPTVYALPMMTISMEKVWTSALRCGGGGGAVADVQWLQAGVVMWPWHRKSWGITEHHTEMKG